MERGSENRGRNTNVPGGARGDRDPSLCELKKIQSPHDRRFIAKLTTSSSPVERERREGKQSWERPRATLKLAPSSSFSPSRLLDSGKTFPAACNSKNHPRPEPNRPNKARKISHFFIHLFPKKKMVTRIAPPTRLIPLRRPKPEI